MFKRFHCKNFNVLDLLTGRVATNIADSLFYMTILWFFKSKFHSPTIVSLIFIADSTIDTLAFAFGPVIDRIKIKQLLQKVNIAQTLLSLICIWLFQFKNCQTIAIVALTGIYVFSTIGSTLIYPAESKILPVIVTKNKLPKINGLFQMTYQSLDLFLDALATLLITLYSFSATMAISALCFALAIIFYRQLHLPKIENTNHADRNLLKNYLFDLKEGWQTLQHEEQIFALILPFAITNLFYGIAAVGLPYFTSKYISHTAFGYGSLELISSIGGLIASIVIQRLHFKQKKLPNLVTLCLFLAGASIIFEVLTAKYFLLLILIFAFSSSFWIGLMNINFEILVQESFAPKILGRIATINSSIINCMIPIGSALGGIIVQHLGANFAIMSQGMAEVM
ncbi:MFS transporter [Lactobacillus sp. HT06-2]|uniref:MFS transporter n=1 Tax=Lactobacillus sp. HT06-2 TaxID=2080222 RepID=UPI000CD89E52|nr:MFS transporter [Lactobacillus sp. HT06-2]